MEFGPFLLDDTPSSILIENTVGSILTLLSLTSVFSSILIGALYFDYSLVLLGASLASFTLVTLQMIRWFKLGGEFDEKFKFMISFLIINVLIFLLTVNVYTWSPSTDYCSGDELPDNTGIVNLYRKSDETCWAECFVGYCLDQKEGNPGKCIKC